MLSPEISYPPEPKVLTEQDFQAIKDRLTSDKKRDASIAEFFTTFYRLRQTYFSGQRFDEGEAEAGLSGLPDFYVGNKEHLVRMMFRSGIRQTKDGMEHHDSMLAVVDRVTLPGGRNEYNIDIDLGSFLSNSKHAALAPKDPYAPAFPFGIIETDEQSYVENKIVERLLGKQYIDYRALLKDMSQMPSAGDEEVIRNFLYTLILPGITPDRLKEATKTALHTRAFPQLRGMETSSQDIADVPTATKSALTETQPAPPPRHEKIYLPSPFPTTQNIEGGDERTQADPQLSIANDNTGIDHSGPTAPNDPS
jgi:hypothetical protein